MASVQERLQLKRVPLENWSISEQLYLASAVACSGDQNWMSVSRSLKMLCGHNRPSDWFSQKSCAAQYEMLLENVETPKRKKRNEKDASQTIVETPIELIVRKLTQERITELNKLLQEERDEYIKLKEEMGGIQNNRYEDNQLREMLAQIDAEEKQRERDTIKYNQWLKEREERKREIEKAWRSNTNMLHQSPASSVHLPTMNQHLSQRVKIEEMEIDDPNSKQGTSPLLTSLLKSPSAAPNPSPSMLHNISNTQTRVAAPTITNLLTGSVTNLSNSLAAVAQQTTSKSIATSVTSISTAFPSQIQNQPLTGPAPNDQSINNIAQSPSQAAPTLSMLLESKQKDHHKLILMGRIETQQSMHQMVQQSKHFASTSDITPKTEPTEADINNAAESEIKDEEQQLMEVFSDMIPDDIDELANIILDGLISEEQVSTVATVAESFVGQENLDVSQSQEITTVIDTPVKEEPSNINENACDASDLIEPKIEEPVSQIEKVEENVNQKIDTQMLKYEDSSDLSNDTPLSELIKQDASVKQQQLKLQSPVTVSDVKKEEPIDTEDLLETEPEQNIHDDLAVLSEEPTVVENRVQNEEQMEMNQPKEEIEPETEQNEAETIDLNAKHAQNDPKDTENTSGTSNTNTEEEQNKVNIELIPIDSSDDSDDKSLENIKREIEALPELKDSNESSPAPPDEKAIEETTPEKEIVETEIIEIVHEPKVSRSSSRKEASRKSDSKSESKKSAKTENVQKTITIDDEHKIEAKETKKERKQSKTETQENIATTVTTEMQNKSDDSVIVNEPMVTVENVETQQIPEEENEGKNSNEDNIVEIIDETFDDVGEIKNVSCSTADNIDEKTDGAQEASSSMKGETSDEKDRKSDDSRQDSVILIDESDEVSTDKNTTSSTTKSDESSENADNKEKSNTPAESDRKASSDEEVFEDAKEHLDEVTKTSETELEKPSLQPPTITVDTDDDAPFMEVAKEDKVGRVKRDYSRRKQDPNVDKREEPTEDNVNSGSISSRLRTKDRDRSESPFVEEDMGEPSAKYRRRYSTTPLIDSLPNSPASSDDREYRSWKKSILLVYNSLAAHRCASMFSKPITEEQAPNYKTYILNPMDLHTLKRNVDSGIIRTTVEFKRYVMLMCYNSIFYNINDQLTCSRAKEMLNDALTSIKEFSETWKKENEKPVIPTPTNSTTKGRGRKSNRLAN